jgi:hypothetical protein
MQAKTPRPITTPRALNPAINTAGDPTKKITGATATEGANDVGLGVVLNTLITEATTEATNSTNNKDFKSSWFLTLLETKKVDQEAMVTKNCRQKSSLFGLIVGLQLLIESYFLYLKLTQMPQLVNFNTE